MERVNSITKKIGEIYFSLLSPNEIRKMSATKVITADTYDEDGFPIAMGLMDPRMGVIEPGLRCKTCGQRVGKDKCPGHFGHIDLAMPVIHVGHVKTIRDCLRSTCRDCGHLLLNEKQRDDFLDQIKQYAIEGRNTNYLYKDIITEARKSSNCPHCGREIGKIELVSI